jgi:putative intracellular protease/amidase
MSSSERLVTGQNPASAVGVAREVLRLLEVARTAAPRPAAGVR